jgi:hypothetical protein
MFIPCAQPDNGGPQPPRIIEASPAREAPEGLIGYLGSAVTADGPKDFGVAVFPSAGGAIEYQGRALPKYMSSHSASSTWLSTRALPW